MAFNVSIVDAKYLGNNRYTIKSGIEWGISVDNQLNQLVNLSVTVNGKLVPKSWIFGPEQKGTLEKSVNVKHYFTFKAPTKVGTKYSQILVRAKNDNGSILATANLCLVDARNFKDK